MCADKTAETPDYKDTLNLPKTDFPMRAGLPKREPDWLARWEKIGVYDRLREKEGRAPFTLHDGPPYANGNLHIGHALNKTIKDIIVRSHQMLGHDSRYVPAGTATACRSSGRSSSSTARRAGQGRRRRGGVPPGMPPLRRALDRRPARGVQAPRRHRQLGRSLPDDGFPRRAGDRRGVHEIPDERLALPGLEARDVVAGGEDRAGRGGGGVPRPPDGRGVGAVPVVSAPESLASGDA
jgi:hypothetical protein